MFAFVLEFKNSCYSSSYWERNVYYFFSIPFVSFEGVPNGFLPEPETFLSLRFS